MGRYIARRLLQGIVVIFGVTVFVFVVTRIIGDPVKFMLPLSATEEQRAAREGLTEEELAIFDLLTTPEPKLTKAEEQEVKRVAKRLLERLHELVDAVDWVRGQETRGAVWSEIRVRLNDLPEQPYPPPLWDAKVDQVWDFVLRRYAGDNAMSAS